MGHVTSATVWPGVPHSFQIININLRYGTSDKNWTTRGQLNSQCSNKKTGYPNSWYFFRLWLRKARVEWATLPCCSVTMATPKWHHVLVNPYRLPGDIARWHHSLSVGNASTHCIPTYIFPKYLPQIGAVCVELGTVFVIPPWQSLDRSKVVCCLYGPPRHIEAMLRKRDVTFLEYPWTCHQLGSLCAKQTLGWHLENVPKKHFWRMHVYCRFYTGQNPLQKLILASAACCGATIRSISCGMLHMLCWATRCQTITFFQF